MKLDLAILSCGPSLQGFLDAPVEHDAYMAVNRAAVAWPCQWWAARDIRVLETVTPMGSPAVCTGNDMVVPSHYEQVVRDQDFEQTLPIPLPTGDAPMEFVPPGAMWKRRSALFAVVVAVVVCEATAITLYGYDLTGDKFWDGEPVYTPGVHSIQLHEPEIDTERWKAERLKLNAIVAWARHREVTVCHGQPRQTCSGGES